MKKTTYSIIIKTGKIILPVFFFTSYLKGRRPLEQAT